MMVRLKPLISLSLTPATRFKAPQKHFIDNITFDGKQPNAYLEKFPIGLKDKDTI